MFGYIQPQVNENGSIHPEKCGYIPPKESFWVYSPRVAVTVSLVGDMHPKIPSHKTARRATKFCRINPNSLSPSQHEQS